MAVGICRDDHQDALALMIQAGAEVDTVSPEIDVALGGEIRLLPGYILFPPKSFQPGNGAGRQTRRVRTQKCRQGLPEAATRDAFQVKSR